MNTQLPMPIDTARAVVNDKGRRLAMDESNPTCNKRFAKLGIPHTVEARRAYRGDAPAEAGGSLNPHGDYTPMPNGRWIIHSRRIKLKNKLMPRYKT